MNLENTKVYTTDKEVIRKYAELCGVVDILNGTSVINGDKPIGVFKGYGSSSICRFGKNALVNRMAEFTNVERDQINDMYDGNFNKPESEIEWKNGDECSYDRDKYTFVGMTPTFNDFSCVIFDSLYGIKHVDVRTLSKPETAKQRKDRERLEAIEEIQDVICKNGFLAKTGTESKNIAQRIYDAGYRKEQN